MTGRASRNVVTQAQGGGTTKRAKTKTVVLEPRLDKRHLRRDAARATQGIQRVTLQRRRRPVTVLLDAIPCLEPQHRTEKMKLMLVAGAHPDDAPKNWTLVGRGGFTFNLRNAMFFPFTAQGKDQAFAAAHELKAASLKGNQWTVFVARVLLVGPADDPSEVTPAWMFESTSPRDVPYFFD
jgi:hypothetical protein